MASRAASALGRMASATSRTLRDHADDFLSEQVARSVLEHFGVKPTEEEERARNVRNGLAKTSGKPFGKGLGVLVKFAAKKTIPEFKKLLDSFIGKNPELKQESGVALNTRSVGRLPPRRVLQKTVRNSRNRAPDVSPFVPVPVTTPPHPVPSPRQIYDFVGPDFLRIINIKFRRKTSTSDHDSFHWIESVVPHIRAGGFAPTYLVLLLLDELFMELFGVGYMELHRIFISTNDHGRARGLTGAFVSEKPLTDAELNAIIEEINNYILSKREDWDDVPKQAAASGQVQLQGGKFKTRKNRKYRAKTRRS
jgi:hypothetical protein